MTASGLPSRLDEVVVHARGALVTRVVDLPADLPGGTHDFTIDELPLGATAGSFRAVLEGSTREIVSLKSALVLSEEAVLPGATVQRLRDLRSAHARTKDELERVEARRARYAVVPVQPEVANAANAEERDASFAERFTGALAAIDVLRDVAAELDARSIALREELSEIEREIAAAELADHAASSEARRGKGHARRACTLRLLGEGAPGRLLLKYVVPLARWWPRYSLRVATRVRAAEWRLEAIVSQRSGEDWRGVKLSLSTADLVTDARLPELRSLRFGRAQPRRATGYREPPAGLEGLFASFDRARGALAPPLVAALEGRTSAPPAPVTDAQEWDDDHVMTAARSASPHASPVPSADDAPTPPFGVAASLPSPIAMPRGMVMRPQSILGVGSLGGGPPPAPAARGMVMRSASATLPAAQAATNVESFEPGDDWLDYDALVLEPFEASRQRGKLVRARARESGPPERARRALEALDPAGASDPLLSRGAFDHRYEASARVDVPSDDGMHRLSLLAKKGPVELSFRAAPRASEQVYREAKAKNPFDVPLLAGPLEVHIDGGYVAETMLRKTDRGGELVVGLGIEERLRVVRHVRVAEESAGLLGGGLAVRHDVTVELASTLGFPVRVDVVDVVPITDDKEVTVERTRSSHPEERYEQRDHGPFLRGGVRFAVDVPAAAKVKLDYGYVLKFSAKLEIVGGNRRE